MDDQQGIFETAAAMIARGDPGVLATVIRTRHSTPRHAGSKMLIDGNGRVLGTVGGGAAEAEVLARATEVLATGRPCTMELDLAGRFGVCGGRMEIFLEPIMTTIPFTIIGGGHVGRAVAELGKTLAFRFTVVDDRPEYVEALTDLPWVQPVLADPDALGEFLTVQDSAGVLVASRGVDLDVEYYAAVLEIEKRDGKEFRFLGGLASQAKAAVILNRLGKDQANEDRLERLFLPVGLEIGAESPAEIGLSILPLALAVLRGVPQVTDADGKPLGVGYRTRKGP